MPAICRHASHAAWAFFNFNSAKCQSSLISKFALHEAFFVSSASCAENFTQSFYVTGWRGGRWAGMAAEGRLGGDDPMSRSQASFFISLGTVPGALTKLLQLVQSELRAH